MHVHTEWNSRLQIPSVIPSKVNVLKVEWGCPYRKDRKLGTHTPAPRRIRVLLTHVLFAPESEANNWTGGHLWNLPAQLATWQVRNKMI